MLVSIAQLLLAYLLHGAWRDPEGFNFPQSKAFDERVLLPLLADGQRATLAFPLMLALRSEEHTSELQSPDHLVCRLLLEKKNTVKVRQVIWIEQSQSVVSEQ